MVHRWPREFEDRLMLPMVENHKKTFPTSKHRRPYEGKKEEKQMKKHTKKEHIEKLTHTSDAFVKGKKFIHSGAHLLRN